MVADGVSVLVTVPRGRSRYCKRVGIHYRHSGPEPNRCCCRQWPRPTGLSEVDVPDVWFLELVVPMAIAVGDQWGRCAVSMHETRAAG